ncbi:MAG: hypothetical protein KGZ88_15575 [Methylomicrobium sp.]|nr:hypothetical protein [Methylomicrobium sp.]
MAIDWHQGVRFLDRLSGTLKFKNRTGYAGFQQYPVVLYLQEAHYSFGGGEFIFDSGFGSVFPTLPRLSLLGS